jgi:hypothetical protein
MNFLRAFGEQIGILTPAEHISPEAAVGKQSAQSGAYFGTAIPHCCFYCSWCGSEILLPHDSLGYAFGGPMIRKIETRSIGTVCTACGHAGAYSLFRGCPGYDTRHKFVETLAKGRTLLLDWLPCIEDSCVFPLPFFVVFDDEFTQANLKERAAQWIWTEVTCSVSHVVRPPAWLSESASYRGALDLNLTRVALRREQQAR